MLKIMIASHRSEAGELLEAIQKAGIVQILDAERAMVSKEWPELQVEAKRPRELEEIVVRLKNSIKFLESYAVEKSPKSLFEPLINVNESSYSEVIKGDGASKLLEDAEDTSNSIESLLTKKENACGHLDMLLPWECLSTAVEELGELDTVVCLTGLLPTQSHDEICEKLAGLSAVIEIVGSRDGTNACIVACMKEKSSPVKKALRSGDFEAVSFEGMTGTVNELIAECRGKLARLEEDLAATKTTATELASDVLKLQMLFDYHSNLLEREQTGASCPATENTVLFEGWVRKNDYKKLEKLVGAHSFSSLDEMEIGKEEVPPVEIDNGCAVRPFETITRLYGMPSPKDVDPTMFLAPFFALFFGLCLTDAGYGLILIALLGWALKKFQGDKGVLWMFMGCSFFTVAAGALTGGWFGDSITSLIGEGTWIDNIRVKMMLFDPMSDPMPFFIISLCLGYIQILFGISIAFFNNLKHKNYMTAFFENLTWLIFLNSLLLIMLGKSGMVPAIFGKIGGWVAISQAVLIFLFTERNSGLAGRLGGGFYALFSAVFYFGDLLSYVRLMALGMVTAGLGMAVNLLVDLMTDIPYVGYVLAALMFVVGHTVNLSLSVLSSFVHSLRLQFVEFFPKFLAGGGTDFKPLKESFQHVIIKESGNSK